MIKSNEQTIQRIFMGDQRMYGMFIGDWPVFLTYLKPAPTHYSINYASNVTDINVKSNTEWKV